MKIKSDLVLQERIAEKCNLVSWHGREYFSALCVFHQEHNPSMLVYSDGFTCKTCGAHGSLKYLWNKVVGKLHSVEQPIKKKVGLPPWKTWTSKYESYENASEAAHITASEMPSLLGYLKKRCIFEFRNLGKFGYIDGWISFPVFDEFGAICDWTLRPHPNKKILTHYVVRPRYTANERHHLYVPDWERLKNSDTIYVCFGIIDAWSLYAAGFASCTGISGKQFDPKLLDDFRTRIIIIPDLWEEIDGSKLAHSLGWRGKVLNLDYPDGCKDINDVHCKYGLDALKSLISN